MNQEETHRRAKMIDRDGLDELFAVLKSRGYALFGPTVVDGAIVYDEIYSTTDLPVGWTDLQEPGRYRLERRGDEALFGFVVGPHSWKKYLFPPKQRLVQLSRNGHAITAQPDEPDARKRALIGVRGCELAAIAIQDRVFVSGTFVDPHYQMRRRNLFVVAVHCGSPAPTCFCTSMGTGPEATTGFDLALTELPDGRRHEFVVDVGSELGASVLGAIRHRVAADSDLDRRHAVIEEARRRISRTLDTVDLKELLYRNYDSAHWDQVAERCLSCANCTMVCPTCFCSTVEDVTDLSGDHAERWRSWDSCFTMDFSYIVGGSMRASTRARYRHWMTHKLATWQDQFGVIGCVGCGRCITWCPVGIDLTAESAMLRESEPKRNRRNQGGHS